jgi:hypothetical protein
MTVIRPSVQRLAGLLLAISATLTLLNSVSAQAPPKAGEQKPGPGSFVDLEKGKIYFEECGSGPTTVILIHDGIAHSAVWDGVCHLMYLEKPEEFTRSVLAFIDNSTP